MASFDPHISIFKDLFPKKIEDLWFLFVFSGNWENCSGIFGKALRIEMCIFVKTMYISRFCLALFKYY